MTDNLPAFPLDHLALRGAPDAPALRLKDKVYSYQTLNHRIGRLAAILAAHDFTAGDRIATWLPKTELACLIPLAAVRAGCHSAAAVAAHTGAAKACENFRLRLLSQRGLLVKRGGKFDTTWHIPTDHQSEANNGP